VVVLPADVAADARIAHVGVAVRDLAEAVAFYRDVLGLVPHPAEEADGATIVALPLGTSGIELLASADPESPIGRFLERHGPGIHHICFRVPDLEAALARCRAAGYRLIDEAPRPGADGRRVAFVHPKATAGILLELTG
jgi:methylmalonyl-CoA/ethylmalonyl-CoA epimerase